MAITSVKEIFGENISCDDKGYNYQRTFHVESDIKTENVLNVKNASVGGIFIPAYGSIYSCNGLTDYGSLLQNINATQDKEVPLHWVVVCQYKPRPSNNNNQGGGSKPNTPPSGKEDRSKRMPEVKIDKIEREVLRPYDLNGAAIMSSTKEPILCPHKVENLLVTISFWDWWLSASTWTPYQNTINSATYWGSPAHTWKCGITCTSDYEMYESGAIWIWWHKTYTFEQKYYQLKPASGGHDAVYQTWDERPVDMGTLVLDPKYTTQTQFPDLTRLVPAKDYYGNAKRSKVFLDGFGREIGTTNSQEDPRGLPVTLGPFQVYKESNYSTLQSGWLLAVDLTSGNYA